MKRALIFAVAMLLSGCFSEPTLDTSTDETVKSSLRKMQNALEAPKRKELEGAIIYFSLGGLEGFGALIGNAFTGNPIDPDTMLKSNLSQLDGLTAIEILNRRKDILAETGKASAARDKERELKKTENELVEISTKEILLLLDSDEFDSAKASALKLIDAVKFEPNRETAKTLLQLAKKLEESALTTQYQEEIGPLLKQDNFTAAEAKIVELLSHIEINVTTIAQANKLLKKTRALAKDQSEFQSYVDKVQVTEFKTKRIKTYRLDNVPAIRIGIKNTGDRSLSEVVTTIFFKNSSDEVIYEKSVSVVSNSPYTTGSQRGPLKPGYISEMPGNEYYTVDSTLNEWQTGNAAIKITEITFSE